jgi:hypothetical protein
LLQFIEACVKYCDVLEKIKPLTDQQNEMAELVETATRQKDEAEAKVRDASNCAPFAFASRPLAPVLNGGGTRAL